MCWVIINIIKSYLLGTYRDNILYYNKKIINNAILKKKPNDLLLAITIPMSLNNDLLLIYKNAFLYLYHVYTQYSIYTRLLKFTNCYLLDY